MKQAVQISAVVDQPQLLEQMVTQLVVNKKGAGANDPLPLHLHPFAVASTETFASGAVMLDDENVHLCIPFITPFLFSCLKKDGEVRVAWCCSLS